MEKLGSSSTLHAAKRHGEEEATETQPRREATRLGRRTRMDQARTKRIRVGGPRCGVCKGSASVRRRCVVSGRGKPRRTVRKMVITTEGGACIRGDASQSHSGQAVDACWIPTAFECAEAPKRSPAWRWGSIVVVRRTNVKSNAATIARAAFGRRG